MTRMCVIEISWHSILLHPLSNDTITCEHESTNDNIKVRNCVCRWIMCVECGAIFQSSEFIMPESLLWRMNYIHNIIINYHPNSFMALFSGLWSGNNGWMAGELLLTYYANGGDIEWIKRNFPPNASTYSSDKLTSPREPQQWTWTSCRLWASTTRAESFPHIFSIHNGKKCFDFYRHSCGVVASLCWLSSLSECRNGH